MNWYKKAQQGLFFYPYGEEPERLTKKVLPVSVDTETGQNIYKCHNCGKYLSAIERLEYKGLKQAIEKGNLNIIKNQMAIKNE